MSFQRIPDGEFVMGSRGFHGDEEPRHVVRISGPFFLATFPVTQEQFATWTSASKVKHTNAFLGQPRHPAENMDWYQAVEFCAWLNRARRAELPAGYVATLPTEAEWEYACRAGTDTEYYTGDGEAALEAAGWYDANSGGETKPVGQKEPNAFGLHDMHGNVDEWCWDVQNEHAYKTRVDGVTDPGVADREPRLRRQLQLEQHAGDSAWREDKRKRLRRGGSWFDPAWYCRSACRVRWSPALRSVYRGFRVCLVPGRDIRAGGP
jgi:formylglycine-generating enzyme required for sulfatase activity